MHHLEYIKVFWEHDPQSEDPVVILYELDADAGRLATRLIDVFADGRANPVQYKMFQYVSDVPVPTPEVINTQWNEDDEYCYRYFACAIDREEFEQTWQSGRFCGDVKFPE